MKVRPPGSKARRIISSFHRFSAPIRLRIPLTVEESNGLRVKDVDGNLYIDMDCGGGLQPLGISLKELVDEVRITAYPAGDVILKDAYTLLENLKNLFGSYKLLLTSSSLESFMTAFSAVLEVSRRFSIIVFQKPDESNPVIRYAPGVYRVPYPYCYRCPLRLKHPECGYACVGYFKDVLNQVGDSASMVIFEPIDPLRCIIPPEAVWRRVVKMSDEAGLTTLCNETEASPGRSGRLFWFERFLISPDIVCLGDGLASGLPIGLVAVKEELAVWKPKPFKASPLSCVSALRLLTRVKEERLLSRAHRLGRLLRKRVQELAQKYEVPGDVRGLGLMVGFEIVKDEASRKPASEYANFLVQYCFRRGVILGYRKPSIVKLTPPLNIGEETLEEALNVLEDGLKELRQVARNL